MIGHSFAPKTEMWGVWENGIHIYSWGRDWRLCIFFSLCSCLPGDFSYCESAVKINLWEYFCLPEQLSTGEGLARMILCLVHSKQRSDICSKALDWEEKNCSLRSAFISPLPNRLFWTTVTKMLCMWPLFAWVKIHPLWNEPRVFFSSFFFIQIVFFNQKNPSCLPPQLSVLHDHAVITEMF